MICYDSGINWTWYLGVTINPDNTATSLTLIIVCMIDVTIQAHIFKWQCIGFIGGLEIRGYYVEVWYRAIVCGMAANHTLEFNLT
jgi:hypothetical protein